MTPKRVFSPGVLFLSVGGIVVIGALLFLLASDFAAQLTLAVGVALGGFSLLLIILINRSDAVRNSVVSTCMSFLLASEFAAPDSTQKERLYSRLGNALTVLLLSVMALGMLAAVSATTALYLSSQQSGGTQTTPTSVPVISMSPTPTQSVVTTTLTTIVTLSPTSTGVPIPTRRARWPMLDSKGVLSPTMQPTAVPSSTPSSEVLLGVPRVSIAYIYVLSPSDPTSLLQEYVVLINQGDPVDLTGWTLFKSNSRIYRFPKFTLGRESIIRIHTGLGRDSATDLYWNQRAPVWSGEHGIVTLKDQTDSVVDHYSY